MRNEKFEKFIAVPKNIISQSKKIILDFIFSKQSYKVTTVIAISDEGAEIQRG